jgi:FtsP/CotA-like multicopper oxidase with cupredoxin domain/plastocyanin
MHSRSVWGSRLLGQVTATTAALALAGTAVVLMGQGRSGAALEAAADSATAKTTAPNAATIHIIDISKGFAPKITTVAKGGTLTVVNDDPTFTHSITSNAIGPNGKPLFDVVVKPGATKSVPISTLGGGTYTFVCKFHGQMKGTLVIDGPPDGQITNVPKFQQPLVQPPRLHGKNIRIVMRKARVRVLPHGPRTPMLTFGGSFPGPTIVRRTGQDTTVTFVNRLPRKDGAVTIHQHGGHQKSKYDGQPAAYLIRHGRKRTYDYPLRDGGTPLPAALRFYHDHRMDKTARNNWFGLQGMFLTTDPSEDRLGLPKGKYDIPLAITDRSFRKHNRLTNPFRRMAKEMANDPSMSGMARAAAPGMETVGQQVLVNGRFAPYKKVRPGSYRLQILNSSLFSSYDFALSNGRPFTQIGTGSGLLPHPVLRTDILLGPAQRADVVVDFRGLAGTKVLLSSIPRTDGSTKGTGSREAALMQFRVHGKPAPKARVPFSLASIRHLNVPKKTAKVWRFGLSKDHHGSYWSINGKRFDPMRVDHKVVLGSTERWKLVNTSPFTHYVHLHEELWRTLERDGHSPPPWERGYEDTWRLDPGESVVVAAKFTDYTGKFMIHCHMLDHEDDGMMATFEVVKRK